MPRLLKNHPSRMLSDPFREIPDQYLQAIEYGGFTYLINSYGPSGNLNKTLSLMVVMVAYESYLLNYTKETTTTVKNFKK